jgi:cyanophycinase
MRRIAWCGFLAMLFPACALAQVKVGPQRGTVIVVGGGSMGPEIYSAFIQAAGGPDALIIDVPTAGGDSVYTQDAAGTRGWRQAGAKNIYVYHTRNRRLADSDSFTAILKKARGIWFEGGRQFHLMDAYAGTKTEQAFREVLSRGGVVGGSSAGATILGDFLVRGAPSSNNMIMYYPGNEKAFGYLRRVAIDQHVVARERLPDLADSIMPRFPELLGISEDEGTAWVVKGDTGTIIGRNKAFVYGGKDKNDAGRPFLTLYPGDKYNLATRRVLHRAADESPVKITFVDSLFSKFNDPGAGGATVLIARGGKVFVARSYGIPDQPRYMPTTTVPQFALGDLGTVFTEICAQLPEQAGRGGANADSAGGGRGGRGGANAGTPLQNCTRRVGQPVGMHKTNASTVGQVLSNVDELYRLFLGLETPRTFSRDTTSTLDATRGWQTDNFKGVSRLSAYWNSNGKRHAFVRIPSQRATVIILTNDDAFDAKSAADAIVEKLIQR